MENKNIDKIIQEKFKNRMLTPSASAWERLSNQLDKTTQEKPKRKWFLYVGYAASVVLLIALFFIMNKKDTNNHIINKEIMVDTKIDSLKIKQELFKESTVKESIVIVETPLKKDHNILKKRKEVVKQQANSSSHHVIARNEAILKTTKKKTITTRKYKEEINNNKKNVVTQNKISNQSAQRTNQSQFRKTKISINPDDLLYEVTHTKKGIKDYYTQYNINRKEVLQRIKIQLKKSNLKINPAIILAEVERDIADDFFQNNFLENLKSKVSTIVVAIVDRNK